MTEERAGNSPQPIIVETAVSEDRRSVILRFKGGDNGPWIIVTDTASIDALLTELGKTRSELIEPVAPNLPDGVVPIAAFNPRWYVLPDTENKFATFWVRHPGFGWAGYGFPKNEAGNISKFPRKVIAVTSTRDTQSPAATSFGGDGFLMTTEGLGFYYYGHGEKRIGPNPFEQIEFDSDRAAGIVAGAIVEQRLEEAIRSRLRMDLPAIASELFRPSGALGPFRTKIDLAHLWGLISDEVAKDLSNLKNIRNDFAHELELDSFDVQSIKDRCKNFYIVDKHVGPVPARTFAEGVDHSVYRHPYLGFPDYQEKLSDPRFRYTMTAQLISFKLGEGSDRPDAPLPLI